MLYVSQLLGVGDLLHHVGRDETSLFSQHPFKEPFLVYLCAGLEGEGGGGGGGGESDNTVEPPVIKSGQPPPPAYTLSTSEEGATSQQ